MDTDLMFSSEADIWRTERRFVKWLHSRFNFTLDAAASDDLICSQFITEQQNALVTPWNGRVFCNPPYSLVEKFVKRALHQMMFNQGCEGVCLLVPGRIDTEWFQDFFSQWHRIEFLRGRLTFWLKSEELAAVNAARKLRGKKPLGEKNSAPFPSMLLIKGFGLSGRMIDVVDWKKKLKLAA